MAMCMLYDSATFSTFIWYGLFIKKGIPELNFKQNTCHDRIVKELLQIILPVISLSDPQVGL